jgi:hypothetical protein
MESSRVEYLLLQHSIQFSRPAAFGNQPFKLFEEMLSQFIFNDKTKFKEPH